MHEDDPERGARAALELAAELPGLVIRGGIHTGVVANILVGTSWRRSFELIGDATNTAARAAKQARWAEIVATREVVDAAPVLVTRPRGMHRVKGKSRPMELRAIVGTRREAVPAMPMTPFLGRDREMETLGDALASAAAGRGSAIGIRGDAGLGKSRIKLEVSRLARARGFEIREARATPFGGGPFQVAIDLLAAKLGIERRAPPRTVRSRIATFAKRHGFALHDRRRLEEIFASGAAGPGLDADALRLNRAVALSATLLATTRPQLLVLEDLHWSDPGSQELLEHVAREASGSATLVLLLYRPGYDPPRGVREIRLKELPGRRVHQLLRSILGRTSRSVEDLVAARAGGNPFYVEEVSRHLLESGILVARGKTFRLVGLPGPGDLPATVESVITSRLSRLSPLARRFCEIGAVVGRSFSSALLDRHPDLKGRTGAALQELGERGLVFETGRDGGEHIFKHAVTRDAAYGSILVARRRSLHRWAAREIESVDAGASPALRGYHWERAGRNGTARACFLAAAEQAATAHALQDAIRFYRDYLGLATRDRPEVLEARLALGRVLHRSGDFEGGNHELGAVVAAASRASRQRQRLAALNALGDLELERNRFGDARPHYEAALGLAEEIGDASRQASILVGLGRVGVVTSRHDEAETLLSRARALYERAHDRAGVARVLSRLAILEDARGRETHATALIQEAIAIHRETGDRGAEGEALGFLGASFTHRGYAAKGALCFREALAIARELGHRRLEAMWLNNLAIADKQLGRLDDASSSFQQAAKIFRTIGVRSYHGQSIANLGGVRADQHRFEEAHQLIRQGLAIVREIGDRRSEAMALTILAKALEAEGRLEEALDASRRGGEIARGLHQVRMEIQALRRQIALLRVMEPRGKRIGALLSRAAILTADLEPNELHLRLLCERGHLQLATGQGARPLLSECGELVRRVRIDEGSDAYAAYLKLARAVERCERGDPLVHGLDPADVPEGVSRWAASARP
ncbi:MAG: tetratricopeptide repeat protein [Acidobacteriota bacterium]